MVSLYKSIFCISLRASRWQIIISIGSVYFVFQSIVNVLRHNSVSGNLVWGMCPWQVNSKRDANDPYLLGFILLCNPLPLSVMGPVTLFFFFNLILAVLGPWCSVWASLVVACRLVYLVACRILVAQPGIKPTLPALQGEFLTIRPPGKSYGLLLTSRE